MSQSFSQITPSTVVQLPGRGRKAKATRTETRKVSRREIAATRQQAFAAIVLGTVATVLVILSLCHLAAGIAYVTGAAMWEAIALAIGIDCSFAALEMTKVLARPRTMAAIRTHLNIGIVGTVIGSAVMNAIAFAAAAPSAWTYPAAALGL